MPFAALICVRRKDGCEFSEDFTGPGWLEFAPGETAGLARWYHNSLTGRWYQVEFQAWNRWEGTEVTAQDAALALEYRFQVDRECWPPELLGDDNDEPTVQKRSGRAAEPLPDLVTLDQAAAAVHRAKRTLKHRIQKGDMPSPHVEGGGGKPALWLWPELRPWLEDAYGMKLPPAYPANVRG